MTHKSVTNKNVNRIVHGSERVKPNNSSDEYKASDEWLKLEWNTLATLSWYLLNREDNDDMKRLQMLLNVVASATQRGVDEFIPRGGAPADESVELDDGCVAI